MILRVREAIASLVLLAGIGNALAQDYARPDYGMMPPPGEAGVPGAVDAPNPVRSDYNPAPPLPIDTDAPSIAPQPPTPSAAAPSPTRQAMGHPSSSEIYSPPPSVAHSRSVTHSKPTEKAKKPHTIAASKSKSSTEQQTSPEQPEESKESSPQTTEEPETTSQSTRTFFTTASLLPPSTSTIFVEPTEDASSSTKTNGIVQPSSTTFSKIGATVRTTDTNGLVKSEAITSGKLQASLSILTGFLLGVFIMI